MLDLDGSLGPVVCSNPVIPVEQPFLRDWLEEPSSLWNFCNFCDN